jgi:hypothetical protein
MSEVSDCDFEFVNLVQRPGASWSVSEIPLNTFYE